MKLTFSDDFPFSAFKEAIHELQEVDEKETNGEGRGRESKNFGKFISGIIMHQRMTFYHKNAIRLQRYLTRLCLGLTHEIFVWIFSTYDNNLEIK